MFKKFIVLTLLIITGCYPNWYKPMGHLFTYIPENGSPGLKLGWIHGCESGLGTQFGGGIYMSFYSWKRDPDITSSNPNIPLIRERYKKELKGVNWNDPNDIKKNFSDYNTIFWSGHIFCRHSVLGNLQTTQVPTTGDQGLIPALPGEDRYDMTKGNIGYIWMIHGKGDARIGNAGNW